MAQTPYYFWRSDGRYLGHVKYDVAIGNNNNINNGAAYYYNKLGTSSSWYMGIKLSGADTADSISYSRLPAAVQKNANTNGTCCKSGSPLPGQAGSPVPVVNTNQSGSTVRSSSSSLALAGVTASSCYTRMMKSGMTGGDVLWVQQKLSLIGNFTGAFDAATVNAVKNFQSRSGLSADGIVGPKTACKLGMTCLNCGGTAPSSSGGGGSTGGGRPTPAPAPAQPPPPPPKPEPPYKLPRYVPASVEVENFNPISSSDLIWANWGVFNAYELALVSHNEYFETLQPNYNVVPNVAEVLSGTDESLFLIGPDQLAEFATPDITQDLALLAFGTSQSSMDENWSSIYAATQTQIENLTKRARLFGIKFIRSLTSIQIDDKGPYIISYISKRMNQNSSYSSAPIILTATATQQITIALSWTQNPYAAGYELYRMSNNGVAYNPPQLVGSFGANVTSWTSPALPPSTSQSFQVKAHASVVIDPINDPGTSTKVYVGTSNEASATTISVGPTALAPLTYLNARNGRLIARFGIPSPSTFFSHVYFTFKEGGYPTSINDGSVVGPFYSGSAGADIELTNIGTGYRPNDRTFYVSVWSFNTAGQQASGASSWYSFFLHNPVEIDHTDVDSWRMSDNGSCVFSRWEPCCNKMRVSNYGGSYLSSCNATVSLKYTGLWFYGNRLQTAMGGRNVTSTEIYVMRATGGSAGAIHTYIGNHGYQNHPSNENEPAISNVAQSPETFPRNSAGWVNLSRFNGSISSGAIVGFGMYRRIGGTVINDTEMWLGQADGAGNAYIQDGRVRIYHTDFA